MGASLKNFFFIKSKVSCAIFKPLKRKNPAIIKKKSTQILLWRNNLGEILTKQ
jgi:hypothetical protein